MPKSEPATPALPYCQMIWPSWSTTNTRLSGQPFIGSEQPGRGGLLAGVPVPERRVKGPNRSASLTPTILCAPGLSDPLPNCQTIACVLRSISITRLLNWSAIKMLSASLKSLARTGEVHRNAQNAVAANIAAARILIGRVVIGGIRPLIWKFICYPLTGWLRRAAKSVNL